MTTQRRSMFEIHTAVLLFGFAGLFGKWLALPPLVIVFGRTFFAALALGVILFFSKMKLGKTVLPITEVTPIAALFSINKRRLIFFDMILFLLIIK